MTEKYDPFNGAFAAFPEPDSLNLAKEFGESAPSLLEASDAELSAFFGANVVSLYPEDMPGFSVRMDMEDDVVESRIDYVRDFIRENIPRSNLAIDDNCYELLATSGAMATRVEDNHHQPLGYILLRPSKHISPEQKLSNYSGVDIGLIVSPLSKKEQDFLDTYHEIGHLLDFKAGQFQGQGFDKKYLSEMSADLSSVLAYYQRQQSPRSRKRIADAVIAERAFTSFLKQTPEYFSAPSLAEAVYNPRFNEGVVLKSKIDPYNDSWKSYFELRLRLASYTLNGDMLNRYSSQDLAPAIYCYASGGRDDIDDWKILKAMECLEEWELEDISRDIHDGSLLEGFSIMLPNLELDNFTRCCAVQILQSAKSICPSLCIDIPSVDFQRATSFGDLKP